MLLSRLPLSERFAGSRQRLPHPQADGFVLRVFDIPIGRIGAEKRPSLRSGFLGALDLAGKIAAVQVIDQRPEGCIKAVYILRIDAVKSVVDGDKAHSEERKDAGDIVADRDVITPETRQIFLCQVGTKKF